MKEQWNKFLSDNYICVVFDTETSGVSEYNNDILSLSWQLVKTSTWEVVSSKNIYFQWSSRDRVSKKAIQINGLTTERLRKLGTIDRKKGMEMFSEAVANSDLVVGHNVTFDIRFVDATIERLGMNPIEWPTVFDTMKPMSKYFGKWPKLVELVDFLEIDDNDIDYHQSSSDVEVTKRCFRKIAEEELLPPPKIIKKNTPKKKEIEKKEPRHEEFSNKESSKKEVIPKYESIITFNRDSFNLQYLLKDVDPEVSKIYQLIQEEKLKKRRLEEKRNKKESIMQKIKNGIIRIFTNKKNK